MSTVRAASDAPFPISSAAPKPGAAKARILIADGEPIICEALAQLVARRSNLYVCGALTEGRKLLECAGQVKPDLVLMDLMLDDCDSFELIKEFRAVFPALPLLVLCSRPEATHAERSIRAGASGYVMKSESPQDLFDAIAAVLGGKMHLSQRISALLLDRLLGNARGSADRDGCGQLTDRELRVFELVGAGMGTREIATRLARSIKTIEAHREHIKTKLGLRNSAERAARAAEWLRKGKAEG